MIIESITILGLNCTVCGEKKAELIYDSPAEQGEGVIVEINQQLEQGKQVANVKTSPDMARQEEIICNNFTRITDTIFSGTIIQSFNDYADLTVTVTENGTTVEEIPVVWDSNKVILFNYGDTPRSGSSIEAYFRLKAISDSKTFDSIAKKNRSDGYETVCNNFESESDYLFEGVITQDFNEGDELFALIKENNEVVEEIPVVWD